MSDNLGPNQSRVLDSTNRNFESITYQRRKPPLSSEVNLGGKIDAERNQKTVQYIIPSGWTRVGQIYNGVSESSCMSGDVVCSNSYTANTFKLIALDKGIAAEQNTAWVNGWRFLVQGSSSSDENNIVILPAPPLSGARVDFVFLEVWRSLVHPADTVYKYGNVLYGGTNYTNDLIDPQMGIETSLRIQTQYRIRVVGIPTYQDIFDPSYVFVQGPLAEPNSTCTPNYFSTVPGDVGLWIAGLGDSVFEELLETVDGHTYAIPMFAVRRRNTNAYDPDLHSNGAGYSLADYKNGLASDRPDNLYSDWVVAEDILDVRHQVLPNQNMKELCDYALKTLMNNNLRGNMTKVTLGEDNYGCEILQADAVSNVDKVGSTKIAQGDGIRRIFSNASSTQTESFTTRTTAQKTFGVPSTIWLSGDKVQITLIGTYPVGATIASIQVMYTNSVGPFVSPTNFTVTGLGTDTATITLVSAVGLISTHDKITFEYTISFIPGLNGLSEVPIQILEARKENSSLSIPMQGNDIRVRTAPPIVTNDGTHFDMLMNRGAYTSEPYDFGLQMLHHTPGTGTAVFSVPRNLYGYDILGINSVTDSYGLRSRPSVTRDATSYTVDLGTPATVAGEDVQVKLYVAGKFFEVNKQSRGVINCFEMLTIIPDEAAPSGSYHIDAVTKKILATGSYADQGGTGYAYVNGTQAALTTNNRILLPLSPAKKTYASIGFQVAPPTSAVMEVPVLVQSAIDSTEGYTFFYRTIPYQGLLDSSTQGRIETVGPSFITTSGSGSLTDFTHTQGTAQFLYDSTVIHGTNTNWVGNIRPGYFIRANADATTEYRITSIYDSQTLFIDTGCNRHGSGFEAYTVVAKDRPGFVQTDIVDRFPTYLQTRDTSAINESCSTAVSEAYQIIETRVISEVQDISDLPPNSFWVGLNAADRGRSTINISGAPLGLGNLGLKFERMNLTPSYKKVYQSYIFNEGNTGRLYLMVVGSETDNTSSSNFLNHTSNNDSVDLFELPGKPIIMGRIG